jgi:RNA polymerase sigma-70 factor (ECF subfamily)
MPKAAPNPAFSELAALHPASFAWALACCGYDRAEAEDVLQTAYLKIVDGRARFEGESSLRTFLFAVIRNTAADARRRSFLRRFFSPQPAAAPDASADRARIIAALQKLSPRQREVMELVFYHDLSVEEAARVMGVGVGSARTHYDRGKTRLAELLR